MFGGVWYRSSHNIVLRHEQTYSLCSTEDLMPSIGTPVPTPSVLAVVLCQFESAIQNVARVSHDLGTASPLSTIIGKTQSTNYFKNSSKDFISRRCFLSISDDGRIWNWLLTSESPSNVTVASKPDMVSIVDTVRDELGKTQLEPRESFDRIPGSDDSERREPKKGFYSKPDGSGARKNLLIKVAFSESLCIFSVPRLIFCLLIRVKHSCLCSDSVYASTSTSILCPPTLEVVLFVQLLYWSLLHSVMPFYSFSAQISLIGQLHLLSSTVNTLAVPSPSLTATLSCKSLFADIHFYGGGILGPFWLKSKIVTCTPWRWRQQSCSSCASRCLGDPDWEYWYRWRLCQCGSQQFFGAR